MHTHPWLSSDAYIQFFDSLYGYRTGSGLPFFRTTDGGETWELVSWYGYMVTFSMQFLTKNIGWISIDGPVLTTSVIKTTNGGEDWFDNITFQCSDLSTYLSFVDTLRGWVVQWTCISGGTEIWNTSDGGTTWNLQFIYSPPFYFDPREIFFVDSLHGWVIGDDGIVLHTSTGGVVPVELISFTAEVLDDKVQLCWTTATETNNQGFEVQRSEVGSHPPLAEEWEAIGFVVGNGTTTKIKYYSFVDENVSTGVYKYRLKQIDFDGTFSFSDVAEVELNHILEEFRLYQNYPNPFNPETFINYQIKDNGFVSLKVYDLIGKEVANLVNQVQPPGQYSVSFDGNNLPSGIYICSLRVNKFVQNMKMTLLK